MKRTVQITLLALLLCFTFIGAKSAIAAEVAKDTAIATVTESTAVETRISTISTYGTSTVSVKPDIATLMLGVTCEETDASVAQSKTSSTMNAIIARLTNMGIKKDNMTTQQITIYPAYDYSDGKQTVRGYQATQMIRVRMTNLNNVGRVLDASIKAGANQVYNVTFALRDQTKAYNEALEKAMEDARNKADIMAKAAGKTVKDIVSVSESSAYSNVEYNRVAAVTADAAGVNNSVTALPGTVSVTASVAVIFLLQ